MKEVRFVLYNIYQYVENWQMVHQKPTRKKFKNL